MRLGDPTSRDALFTPLVAERLLASAFGPMDVFTAPFEAVVTGATLGVVRRETPQLRAKWRYPDGRPGGDVEAALAGFQDTAAMLPGIVEGKVTANVAPVTGRIASVEGRSMELPTLASLEAAASAAERADAAAFERRRQIELAKRIAGAGLSDVDAVLLAEQWVAGAGVGGVTELLDRAPEPAGVERLALQFEFTEPQAPSARSTHFVAGVVIADLAAAGPTLLQMLRVSRELERTITEAGRGTAPLGGLEPQRPAPVIWFVPQATFEDAEWPGGDAGSANQRATARQARAAAWLAGQGVALVGVT